MKLVLATQNKNKLTEIRDMLPKEWKVYTLDQVGIHKELVEEGDTIEQNALQKADFVFKKTGISTLADDSGLEVDVLFGQPGLHSARYAGSAKNDSANRIKLLEEMKFKTNRNAKFRTVLAFTDNAGSNIFQGWVKGYITDKEYGLNGFGYDSIFSPHEFEGLTFAQMSFMEKQKLSHRSMAIKSWMKWMISEKH